MPKNDKFSAFFKKTEAKKRSIQKNAALNTQTGEMLGKTSAATPTSSSSTSWVKSSPVSLPTVIADNLSPHKTKQVLAFLDAHSNLRIHYTPTYLLPG